MANQFEKMEMLYSGADLLTELTKFDDRKKQYILEICGVDPNDPDAHKKAVEKVNERLAMIQTEILKIV